MAPVNEPKPEVGSDARVAFHDMRDALREANARLMESVGWYLGVKKRYGEARL